MTRIWGPSLTATCPAAGRDQITVMLIDDQYLRDYDEVWPVSLGFHQRRLLDLLAYHPRAIFFDIAFLDDRKDPGLDGFIDAACRARSAGVPVFVGAFGDPGMKVSVTQKTMLARHVDVAGQQLPCIEAAYLNLKIDGFDQSVWEYDLDVPVATTEHGARRTASWITTAPHWRTRRRQRACTRSIIRWPPMSPKSRWRWCGVAPARRPILNGSTAMYARADRAPRVRPHGNGIACSPWAKPVRRLPVSARAAGAHAQAQQRPQCRRADGSNRQQICHRRYAAAKHRRHHPGAISRPDCRRLFVCHGARQPAVF